MTSTNDSARSPRDAAVRPAESVYHQRISVHFDYPVHFAADVWRADNPLLESVLGRLGEKRRQRAVVYIDDGLARANGRLIEQINEYFHARPETLELAAPPAVAPGGEAAKAGWEPVRQIIWTLGNLHIDRQSFVIAVGGGAMLDMVGFAASIVHRGLRLVRMPSTVLAQNDAGVGVKNGMDEHGQKNFVGTFAPPFAVINDFSLLRTLSDRDWIGGVAEAIKVALIKDADFFSALCRDAVALRGRDEAAMGELIRRCAVLHLEHIRTGGDPFEMGSARPLDFGHWSAHKIETLSGYAIGHGQAVALGIAIDSFYAAAKGLLTDTELEMILSVMEACGLPTWSDVLERRREDGTLEILDGLRQFQEHLGGALTVTLPDGIGSAIEVHQIDAGVIEQAVSHLRHRAKAR
jgi:3-dehydroquinate synthase